MGDVSATQQQNLPSRLAVLGVDESAGHGDGGIWSDRYLDESLLGGGVCWKRRGWLRRRRREEEEGMEEGKLGLMGMRFVGRRRSASVLVFRHMEDLILV